ncbi:MAG: AbrB/MazE/SpoVT family DNA-binding domain-containing protein [Thermoplasmatota archaeon]
MRNVKISARNQVALPKDALDSIGAQVGERLIVHVRGGILELIPERLADRLLERGLEEFQAAGLSTFEREWDNDEDEAWNDA